MADNMNNEALLDVENGKPYTRRNVMKMGACALGLMALGGAGAFAYFTGNAEVTNETSVAQNLNVKVDEPHWTAGEGSVDILPGQTMAKDPSVVNLSTTIPGYLFAEVRVPRAEVVVADMDGHAGESMVQDLFSYADPTEKGWVALESFSTDTESVYRYAWPEVVDATGGAATNNLFDEVTLVNLVDKQEQSGLKMITVVGYGIQAEPFTNPGDAWEAYKKQNGIEGGGEDSDNGNFEQNLVIVNLTLNDPDIVSSQLCQIKTDDIMVSESFAVDGFVQFDDVSLYENTDYSIVASDVDDISLLEFTTDSHFLSEIAANDGHIDFDNDTRTSFVIYDQANQALRFYKRDEVPQPGTMFGDLYVQWIVTDIEHTSFNAHELAEFAPWRTWANDVKTVSFVDEIRPVSTNGWFEQFVSLEYVYLAKLNTVRTRDMAHMFEGCTKLKTIDVSGFDTRNVEHITNIFAGAQAYRGELVLNVASWDLSKVNDEGFDSTKSPLLW